MDCPRLPLGIAWLRPTNFKLYQSSPLGEYWGGVPKAAAKPPTHTMSSGLKDI